MYPEQIQVGRDGKESKVTKLNDGAVIRHNIVPNDDTYYKIGDEYYTQVYARVLIKHLKHV